LARTKPKPKAEAPESPPPPPPPLTLSTTTQFDRDLKRQVKRGKRMEKLHAVIDLLQTHQALPPSQRDHALTGDRKGWRDCHIEPDWVLIYKIKGRMLILGETGTHSDLFGK
jgi:mRNA interferase YafQ